MNTRLLVSAAALVSMMSLPSAQAQETPAVGIARLTEWVMEDIARQRAKVREQDAAEEARRSQPDLSEFGTPVDVVPRRNAGRSRSVQCTTITMGEGISATDCF